MLAAGRLPLDEVESKHQTTRVGYVQNFRIFCPKGPLRHVVQ